MATRALKMRPTSVTVIGWMFVIFAILLVLSGCMSFIFAELIRKMPEAYQEMPIDINQLFKSMPFAFSSIMIFSILQIVYGVVILVSGIYFLKLKSWARITLEVISWFGLLATLVSAVLGVLGFTASLKVLSELGFTQINIVLGIIVYLVITIIFIIPIIVIIKALRGRVLKEAFK